jgi:hypothetical protein
MTEIQLLLLLLGFSLCFKEMTCLLTNVSKQGKRLDKGDYTTVICCHTITRTTLDEHRAKSGHHYNMVMSIAIHPDPGANSTDPSLLLE